jgi:hypothetical protein
MKSHGIEEFLGLSSKRSLQKMLEDSLCSITVFEANFPHFQTQNKKGEVGEVEATTATVFPRIKAAAFWCISNREDHV